MSEPKLIISKSYKEKENKNNECANELLKWFIIWTEKGLSPEEVLGINECFKYVYLNKFVEKQVKEVKSE